MSRGGGSIQYVSVIGPGDDASTDELEQARATGRLLAERGVIVINGGLGGVMAATAEGVLQAGGVSVGLLPGCDRSGANEHLSVATIDLLQAQLEAAQPVRRAEPVADGWRALAVCEKPPGHHGDHVTRGSSGGGWELHWQNEELW